MTRLQIKRLIRRAEKFFADRDASKRSGVRVIPGRTYAEFQAGVEKLMETEPPADGYGYLCVPEQATFEEWLAKYPPAEPEFEERP